MANLNGLCVRVDEPKDRAGIVSVLNKQEGVSASFCRGAVAEDCVRGIILELEAVRLLSKAEDVLGSDGEAHFKVLLVHEEVAIFGCDVGIAIGVLAEGEAEGIALVIELESF